MKAQINDTVKVRWTWGGDTYVAVAKVIKINRKSVRCELLEEVKPYKAVCEEDVWPAGFFIRADEEDVVKEF